MTTTTAKVQTALCSECHTEQPLRPSGKSLAPHKVDGDKCLGVPSDKERPGTRAKAPETKQDELCKPCSRTIGLLRSGKFAPHKDFVLNARCVGSNKSPAEAAKVEVRPAAKAAPPKAKGERKPVPPRPALTPLAKSEAKAAAFAKFVADHGWATRFDVNLDDIHPGTGEAAPAVTAISTRGHKDNVEEMRITWWGGACIGADGRITWEFKGRKVAVRNASACKMQAQVPHEFVLKQAQAYADRKAQAANQRAAKGRGRSKAPAFDPTTLDEDELIAALTGRALTWHNATAGKEETDTAVKVKIGETKTGRTVTFVNRDRRQRTIKAAALLRVG